MRLIDTDELDDVVLVLNQKGWTITRNDYKLIDGVLFEFPTVDPVKHGHWDECVAIFYDVTSTIASVVNESMAFTPEIRKTIYRCSCCGLSNRSMTDFCQNCGAKMDAFAKDIDVPNKNVCEADEVKK